MNELELFEITHGKPLHVGMSVTVDSGHEFSDDWDGQFVVLGINYISGTRISCGRMDVTIADSWEDGGVDGWKPSDLNPSR